MSAPGVATAGMAAELAALVGGDRVAAGDETLPWTVAGRRPGAVVFPRSSEEVAAVLVRAGEEGWRVVPAGAGRWFRSGNPPAGADVVLSTRRMDRILQYEAADLTLTAQAGVSLEELRGATSPEGQWFPLDPPGARSGTLGATLATGSTGPLQALYGAPRDLTLGLTVVTGDGRILRVGGRVVKNVAGFDLVKPLVGSWGTLAVVTEATVRLFPVPPRDRSLRVEAACLEELVGAAAAAAGAPVQPASVVLDEERRAPGAPARAALTVRLVGSPATVEADARTFRGLLEGTTGGLEVALADGAERTVPGPDPDGLEEGAALVVRLRLPPGELDALVALARTLGRLRGGRDELEGSPIRFVADVPAASLRIAVPRVRTDTGWDERWADRLADLRRTVEVRGGSLTVEQGPPQIVERVGAWGDPGPTRVLVERLKQVFDPAGVLAPGRFVV